MTKIKRRFDEIILHIGTEKTGTTSIQNYLGSNRANLLRQGVLYPRSLGLHHTSQWELLAVAHESPWDYDFGRILGVHNVEHQRDFEQSLERTLTREFERNSGATRVLMSSEHFHSRPLNSDRIAYLKNFLQPYTVSFRIVVYFRRQDEIGLSFQSTRLKSMIDIGEIDTHRLLKAPPGYYDYDQLYKNWAEVFGDEAMKVGLYHEAVNHSDGLLGHFLETCAIAVSLPANVPRLLNRSLNQKGFHFLRTINKLYPSQPGDRSDRARLELVREIERTHSGTYRPISRSDIEEWYNPYRQVNDRLKRSAFPHRSQKLFSSSFAAYPEIAEAREPEYEDAVKIAFELWKNRTDEMRNRRSFWRRALNWLARRTRN